MVLRLSGQVFGAKVRRVLASTLLGIGLLVSFVCVALLLAAWRNDSAIAARTGFAHAEVLSTAFDRTVIRYETPDGVVHIPPNGVLYPGGLEEGQVVRVEYDTSKPGDLVRVAGRSMAQALLPVGSTMVITWAVITPLLLWLRTAGPLFGGRWRLAAGERLVREQWDGGERSGSGADSRATESPAPDPRGTAGRAE